MKKLILIFLVLTSNALAESKLEKYWREFHPNQKCVDIAALGYFIVKKVNNSKDIYEVHTTPTRGSRKAWLKIITKSYNSPGTISGFKVKHIGTFPAQLQNGFEEIFDMLVECSPKESK